MLLWPMRIQRATRDIALRSFTDPDPDKITRIVRTICDQEVADDGIYFDAGPIEIELIFGRAPDAPMRVWLWGHLGNAQIRIQLDLGFTDPVTLQPEINEYPTIMEMPGPRLGVYPKETVVAEKLEAIVQLGDVNSRMKDFLDLYNLAKTFSFEEKKLADCIHNTLEARGTEIPTEVPDGLGDEFANARQTQWTAFLRRVGLEQPEIAHFDHLLEFLRRFLLPPMKSASDGENAGLTWYPEEGWKGD